MSIQFVHLFIILILLSFNNIRARFRVSILNGHFAHHFPKTSLGRLRTGIRKWPALPGPGEINLLNDIASNAASRHYIFNEGDIHRRAPRRNALHHPNKNHSPNTHSSTHRVVSERNRAAVRTAVAFVLLLLLTNAALAAPVSEPVLTDYSNLPKHIFTVAYQATFSTDKQETTHDTSLPALAFRLYGFESQNLTNGVEMRYLRRFGPIYWGFAASYGKTASQYTEDDGFYPTLDFFLQETTDSHQALGMATVEYHAPLDSWLSSPLWRWIRPTIAVDLGAGAVFQRTAADEGLFPTRPTTKRNHLTGIFQARGRLGLLVPLVSGLAFNGYGFYGLEAGSRNNSAESNRRTLKGRSISPIGGFSAGLSLLFN